MKRIFITCLMLFILWVNGAIGQEKRVVVIDAGHGGTDLGAIGTNQIKEKDITLALALSMAQLNKALLNDVYEIYLTRYTDTLISLNHRAKLARVLKPDLFISLHCNHAKNKRATGIEIYLHRGTSLIKTNQKKGNDIAVSINEVLTEKLGYRSRGIKQANFQVLRETVATCPAILVELGFLSNSDEAGHLESKNTINALALAILMAIKL
ncbi:N-acetylmuramoyl-L-alanine amidase family protein [Flagellimonas onchidii]|uniref:N-acetylmuramoyl-L-alanine amidase family protein n=1 Tax=Flagellimonas onchidii TaxID=2562684 RepID=UPI001F0F6389|nr:N-acetylmuramoyl-L-alanine amidase [Allomuricauda onchidii]